MPALPQPTIDRLETMLLSYVESNLPGYTNLEYISCGGSAAIFSMSTPNGTRVLKIFDPELVNPIENLADKRRLDIQEKLIGHECPNLVQTYSVAVFETAAIVEMEHITWPRLSDVISAVPDDKVYTLIKGLITAVRYLESLEIVHRDIKPENIHVSDDFDNLILLDLGVVRDLSNTDESMYSDQDNRRPFLATAQYSSPEYLFRLDEPTTKLWYGLNIYQVGAVLHDLIEKAPLFSEEVEKGNRWLVARAVLSKIPSFLNSSPNKHLTLKRVALQSLSKNIDTRLKLVTWEDFVDIDGDPIQALKNRLLGNIDNIDEHEIARKLKHDRDACIQRVLELSRVELIKVGGTEMPLICGIKDVDESSIYFTFTLSMKNRVIDTVLKFSWREEPYVNTANINLIAYCGKGDCSDAAIDSFSSRLVAEVTIDSGENIVAHTLVNEICTIVNECIDRLVVNPHEFDNPGTDLLTN